VSSPVAQAAPVSAKKKVVCKKRVVRSSLGGKKRTVKRCWKVRVKKVTTASTPTSAPSTPASPVTADMPPAPGGIRAELRDCANSERRKVGLPALADDPILDLAAQGHALDMKLRSYFAHETPGGKSPFDRIDDAFQSLTAALPQLRPFEWMGENIARGFPDVAATCEGWMNSPGHKANILRPQFDTIGTGWVDGYAVQNFGGRD